MTHRERILAEICGQRPVSTSSCHLRQFVDELITRCRRQTHLVLGVSDMVTADAGRDHLQ
jgi:hypothetical protein